MIKNRAGFIKSYVKALREGNAAIFAGAGLSVGAGYVNWKGLLKDISMELELDIDREEHDLVGLAQYYCNEKNSRGTINQIILEEFKDNVEVTENHKILARLPLGIFWTTNYDTLIEEALYNANKIVDVKIDEANLAITLPKRDAIVYKMHGDVSQVQKAIITRDDYEKYSETHTLFTTVLKGDLVSKTFLFIGFSFNDPNLNYILSRVRIGLEGNQRPHYCILKKVERKEFNDEESYLNAKTKQLLQIKDLKRYAINTLLIDDYSEITQILKDIEYEFMKKNIFISGSAEEYGDFTKNEAANFLHDLSNRLVRENFKVISGFGLGVGSYIINGVLEYGENNKKSNVDDMLILRPFPQKESGDIKLETLWQKYREKMISQAGIAIFVFGNKKKNGALVNADGLDKEFKIAKEKGLKIIPVGVTGYQSRLIYNEIIDNFEEYYPNKKELKPLFEEMLKIENKDSILDIILEFISKL